MVENTDEVRVTIRLPADLHQMVKNAAVTDRRSLNAEVVTLLEIAMAVVQRPAGSPAPTVDEFRKLNPPAAAPADNH